MTTLNLKKDYYGFKDSDTLSGPDSHNVRLRDVDGPEASHIIQDKGWFFDDNYDVSKGEYKGDFMTDLVSGLAKKGGYDKTVVTGDEGYFGRDIGDKVDAKGGSFTNKLLFEGILPARDESSQQVVDRGDMYRMMNPGVQDIWSEARDASVRKDAESGVGWKETAVNEQQLAQEYSDTGNTWGRYKTDEVQNRHEGMDIYGQADNAFTGGLESGLGSIQASAYGAVSAIGDLFDSEGIYQWGKAQADAQEYENKKLGSFINSIGDVNSIGDTGRYIAGMTGQMIPYLAGLFGATVVGSGVAAVTGVGALGVGIGVGVPALVYSGEVYNNMEGDMSEKKVGYALSAGMAASLLDRLGLKGLMKPSDFLKKDIDDQLIQQFADKHNIPVANARIKLQNQAHAKAAQEYARINGVPIKEAAEKVSKELVDIQQELMKEIGGRATLELNKGLLAREGLHRVGTGGFREMITEVGQEATMYAGAVGGSEKEWNNEEFGNIVMNAAAGGAIIGGGISGTTGVTGSLTKFSKAQRDYSPSDGSFRNNFYEGSTEGNLMAVQDAAMGMSDDTTIDAMDAEIAEGKRQDTIKEKGIVKTLKEFPRRFAQKQGAIIENIVDKISPEATHTLLTLLDNFAPSNQSHMAGVAFGKLKQTLTTKMQRDITITENNLAGAIGTTIDAKGRKKASDMLTEWQRFTESTNDLSFSNVPMHLRPHIEALSIASGAINASTDALHSISTKQSGEIIGKQTNYFSKATKLDPNKIRKNKGEFMKMAREYLGYSQEKADIFYDVLVNGPKGYDATKLEELGFGNNTRRPENFKRKTAELHKYKDIDKFLHDNRFDQMRAIAEQDINYAIDKKYIGTKGEKVKRALALLKEQMGDQWDPRIAAHIMDSIAAARQDYRPIKNKTLRELQSWLSWYNATTQLHGATLSSIPELAMMMIGATGQRNTDAILGATHGVARKLRHDFKKNYAKVVKNSGYTEDDLNAAVDDFYGYGYSHTEQGAIAAYDVELGLGKGSVFREKTMRAFFNVNLLAPFTDATRVARLSIANDAIFSDLDIVANFYLDNATVSNYAADAWGRLRDINVNPHKMAAEYQSLINDMKADPTVDKMDSDSIHKYIKRNNPKLLDGLDRARKSFVDNALANPNPVDRPLWYSNPHFRLMTQYNGFLSTFTAHILPKIWKNVKEGNPSARYNGVAAAAGMLALGFIGQGLKDDIDREGKPPKSLTEFGYYQRGVMASGLFGTTERFINMAHPLYGSWRSPMDRLTGEIGPFTGSIENAYRAADNAAQGLPVDMSRLIPASKLFNSYKNIYDNTSGE